MMTPIGYVTSPFLFKNGTPRQATVCSQARGVISIEKSVFNNPEHSLEGLEDFTHVWILFLFHKNNNTYTKAKVKPPRLNGKRVGLFSTRSPYRPNNVGLTLAKIECISGATLTVSGIDIIDGTPVIDIKPYIPQYDCPSATTTGTGVQTSAEVDVDVLREDEDTCSDELKVIKDGNGTEISEDAVTDRETELNEFCLTKDNSIDMQHSKIDRLNYDLGHMNNSKEQDAMLEKDSIEKAGVHPTIEISAVKINSGSEQSSIITPEHVTSYCDASEDSPKSDKKLGSIKETSSVAIFDNSLEESSQMIAVNRSDIKTDPVSKAAQWIDTPPIQALKVRFTPTALKQLENFSMNSHENDLFRLKLLKSPEDAKDAIRNILSADPRSTYRRKNCVDSLYYFTIDTIHITSWFDDCIAEVVRVKPACLVEQCKHKYT